MIKGQVLYAKESGSQILFDEIKNNVIYAHVRVGTIDYPVRSLASILSKGYWQEIYTQYQIPETFEKHASHDQSSHGSWARGGLNPDVASKIQQFTREWGGLTISMVDGSMPDSGYVVAKPPEFGKVVEEADFFDPVKGPEILADYLIEHQKDLGGKNYLGTWVKDGKVYLDVAENIQDKDVATQIGRERNQLAIWDVVNLQEIDTGGTGLVEKESQHGRITRPDTNDRRANSRVRKRDSQKTNTVRIKFAPDLKPILKHAAHDQSSHGSWAKGGGKWSAYGARAEGIAAHEGELTSDDILEMMVDPEDTSNLSDEEIKEAIENSGSDFYREEFNKDVERHLNDYGERDEDGEWYPSSIEEAEEFAVQQMREYYPQDMNELAGNVPDQSELVDRFNDMYSYNHDSGMYSAVERVDYSDSAVRVSGFVYDENGETVGEFTRTFQPDGYGGVMVDHDLFRIVEPAYQGKGFGRGFIENQENAYIAGGISQIRLYSAWDGAYTWSRAGYDFDPDYVQGSVRSMSQASWITSGWDDADILKLQDLRDRSASFNMSDPDFPFPHEWASLPDAKTTLFNQRVYFQKILTPEGVRLIEGAIDADGDGIIFEGTPRQRQAPPPVILPDQLTLFDKSRRIFWKHYEGKHDQSSHGSWASYGGRASGVASREADGVPTADDIKEWSSVESDDTSRISDDELHRIVQNDRSLQSIHQDIVDDRISAFEPNEDGEYTDEQWDEVYEEAYDDMRQNYGSEILYASGEGSTAQVDAFDAMSNVYDYTDPSSGMRASVEDVALMSGGVSVTGSIYAPDGTAVGTFDRTFYVDGDKVIVKHELFEIDDPDWQGKGFGRKWIEYQEDAYIAGGIDEIQLGTAWDGAYTWSRSGYDWSPNAASGGAKQFISHFDMADKSNWSPDDIALLENLRFRASNSDIVDPNFPFPYEFLDLPDAKSTLYNGAVKMRKVLTPEGVRLTEGAIDADGDGMVFDGTPRERPATP